MTGPAATSTSTPGVLSQRRRRAAWGLAVVAGLSFIAGVAKGDPPPREQPNPAPSKLPEVTIRAQREELRDLNPGQLTDYAAMVGLVEVRPNTDVGNTTPTILRLFTGSAEPAPADLTGWDSAFLKALYGTDHRSKTQRDDIFLRVLHDIAP